jgi:hypothetical protein
MSDEWWGSTEDADTAVCIDTESGPQTGNLSEGHECTGRCRVRDSEDTEV